MILRILVSTLLILVSKFPFSLGIPQAIGSCSFENQNIKENGLCGYTHGTGEGEDSFNWVLEASAGGHYMKVETDKHEKGQKAWLYSPTVQQQDTHCFSFQYHMEGVVNNGNSSLAAGQLNVHVFDTDSSVPQQPVWNISSAAVQGSWTTVQLALNPRGYQIVFEAVILESIPGVIAIDNIKVNTEACELAPHFLRVGDKEVNAKQNVSLQCFLWGHHMIELDDTRNGKTIVMLQKSNGDVYHPSSRKMYDDHLGVVFRFDMISTKSAGKYRCVSHNATEVGVSNYARLSVKTPPVPQQPPEVQKPDATNLVLNLNADNYIGDEPIVRKVLKYRPVSGCWSDVHDITTSTYHLWHLKPDTEYEFEVILVRPGIGGEGEPGPALKIKTSCGAPLRSVGNVKLQPIASSEIKITWQTPDFSMTQCHFHSYLIKYRQDTLEDKNSTNPVKQYKSKHVEDGNVAVISGLEPFTRYLLKIELTNSAGSIETGDYTVMTGEGAPGPVPKESFQVIGSNETTISVKWQKPEITNGDLREYEVALRGMSSYQPGFIPQEENGLFKICPSELNATLDSLHPGTNYTLSIRAKTDAGFGEAVEITASTKIAPPKMPVYPSPTPDNGTASTPTSIEITVQPAEAHGGPVSHYYIIIEEIPETQQKSSSPSSSDKDGSGRPKSSRNGKRRKKKKRDKRSLWAVMLKDEVIIRSKRQTVVSSSDDDDDSPCYSKPITYEESVKQNKPFYFGGKLSPEEVTEGTKFNVGGGGESNGFSNPPLDPNKRYNIYVRADSVVGGDTKVGCSLVAIKARIPVTTTAPPPTTTASPTTPTTTVSSEPGENPSSGINLTPYGGTSEGHEGDNEEVMLYASIGGGIVGFLILIVIFILIVIHHRRSNMKKQRKEEVVNPFEVRMMMTDMSNGGTGRSMARSEGSPDRQALMMPDVVGFEHPGSRGFGHYLDKSAEAGSSGAAMGAYASPTTPIADDRLALRVDDFHIHVNQMKQQNCSGFNEEFLSFHEGQTAPWEVGKRDENRPKNRYGNIMAYDHSRIVLEPPSGHEEEFESDYINASYISGYKSPSMYIASQAPSAETINDFWLMIWQEKCSVVLMVTNLVEMGKRKCHKYWPEETEQYGTIRVSLNDTEELCDFTIRTFVIQQDDGYDVREVKQFHFTSWPDHGVPVRPTNILSFVRRVKAYEPPGQGPTLVHCSAGAGRTGCYIVIDMMLDMARDEGIIDIYNTVRDLRTRRVNMVQTAEQYVFIHDAILEALLCGDTLVSAPDLRQHYDDLITVDQQTQIAPVQEEFETLNVMTPKLLEDECSVARLPRNRNRNRFMDVLPADRQMPYLVTPDPTDPESNYINSVFVDSYSKRNAFLVTQMPLPSTVIDFWRLVYDYNCTSVIMMNDISEHDQTCSQYWPDNGSGVFGPFTVELLRKEDEVDVVTRLFKMQNINRPSEGFRIVQQFQLINWPATQPVPFTRNAVLRVIQLVTKWQEECARSGQGRMLVHCVAGAGRSGTFIACYNMCAQLRQEFAVDVFNIVQRLRNIRPQLVETLEQYRFCYEVGWDFADQ